MSGMWLVRDDRLVQPEQVRLWLKQRAEEGLTYNELHQTIANPSEILRRVERQLEIKLVRVPEPTPKNSKNLRVFLPEFTPLDLRRAA